MTGFGAGRAKVGTEEVSVEIRSVNHKFCEVKARLPRELVSLEPLIGKLVRERVARGSVEVTVRRVMSTATGTVPVIDLALAKEYHQAFQRIAEHLGLGSAEFGVVDIASQLGVIRLEEGGVAFEEASQALQAALGVALQALADMRRREGESLKADLLGRLRDVQTLGDEVATLVPQSVQDYQRRLAERVQELTKGVEVDAGRLAQEVAFFAERVDVSEELTRLGSHLRQFRELAESAEPAGRKMDFLVQEMHREVNTTGSKSQHSGVSAKVVALKAELERVREQVQNVE